MSCCPDIWYCTPDGPVAVSPDDAGHYTPPEGWTGGPFASPADIVGDCGCPTSITCPGCEADPFQLPAGGVGLYVSDVDPATPAVPSYTALPLTGLQDDPTPAFSYSVGGWVSGNGVALYQGLCSGDDVVVYVQVHLPWSPGNSEQTVVELGTGWSATGNTSNQIFTRTFTCGEQFDTSAPVYVGRMSANYNAGGPVEYDVYLGPLL